MCLVDGEETGVSESVEISPHTKAVAVIDNATGTMQVQQKTAFGSSEVWIPVEDASGTTDFVDDDKVMIIETGGEPTNFRFEITAYTSGTARAGIA